MVQATRKASDESNNDEHEKKKERNARNAGGDDPAGTTSGDRLNQRDDKKGPKADDDQEKDDDSENDPKLVSGLIRGWIAHKSSGFLCFTSWSGDSALFYCHSRYRLRFGKHFPDRLKQLLL